MKYLYALLAWVLSPLVGATGSIQASFEFEQVLPFAGIVYVDAPGASVRTAVLDQKDKAFSDRIVMVTPGTVLRIKNSDDFTHNIFVDDKDTGIAFDIGSIKAHDQFHLPIRWKSDTLMQLGCKIHPRMKSYIANIESNHFVTVEFMPGVMKYEAAIDGVPPGQHRVKVLLPNLEPMVFEAVSESPATQQVMVNGRQLGTVTIQRLAGGQ